MAIRDIDTDAAAAHEMFQSFEGMEGVPVSVASAPQPRLGVEGYLRRIYPGVLVAITIARQTLCGNSSSSDDASSWLASMNCNNCSQDFESTSV